MAEKLITAPIEAAVLQWLDDDAILHWVSWLFQEGSCPDVRFANTAWASAECCDTFSWGIAEAGAVVWGVRELPECGLRQPLAETALDVRVFCDAAELSMWRASLASTWRARIAADASAVSGNPLSIDRNFQFEGTVQGAQAGHRFTRRIDGAGNCQVCPQGEHVVVRSYLERLAETGAVRIAMNRLVRVESQSAS